MIQLPPAVRWIPLAAWLVVIFAFSAQPATVSGGNSAALVAGTLDHTLGLFGATGHPSGSLGDLEHLLRKTGHFLEYLVLGSLALYALAGLPSRNRPVGLRAPAVALLLCVGYAATDETHQLFVPGRTARWQDVVIDGAGALTGILLLLLAGRRMRRAAREPLSAADPPRTTSG